ncbi:MAG TPA: molybdate ABC transporter substrate-binding protein [Candidatus Limnocylindrales bacterium]|nr:molybdate ABC transporter substrate-binding protein [Candidatus Limnocylindrales bacterium]
MTARAVLVAALALAAILAGCGRGSAGSGDSSASDTELAVFAAASLGPAVVEIGPAYATVEPGVAVLVSTDSSAALATQIEHGAPADVFLSADTRNAERLVSSGIAEGAAVPFAMNGLAIVVPNGNPGRIRGPDDLARPGVQIVAAGEEVPITAYAAELIDRLAGLPGYPPDFASGYTANVVSREDSVAGVIAKVGLGEGDAGIVYATDAAAAGDLESIPIPAEANVIATYAAVVVRGPDARAAAAFVEWLVGPDGQAMLAAHGFLPVG